MVKTERFYTKAQNFFLIGPLLLALGVGLLWGMITIAQNAPPLQIEVNLEESTGFLEASRAWMISQIDCITIRWNVSNTKAIYLNGEKVSAENNLFEYCRYNPLTVPEFRIINTDGIEKVFRLEIGFFWTWLGVQLVILIATTALAFGLLALLWGVFIAGSVIITRIRGLNKRQSISPRGVDESNIIPPHLRRLQWFAMFIASLIHLVIWLNGQILWLHDGHVDPEYPYAMTSLATFHGYPYDVWLHHPGTPLKIAGTALYAATYPAFGGDLDAFTTFHVRSPELFLSLGRSLILIMYLVTVNLIIRYAIPPRRPIDVLTGLAVSLLFYIMIRIPYLRVGYMRVDLFLYLNYWTHNSLNYPVGGLLLLSLWILLRRRRNIERWQVIILSFGTGIFGAAQVYFITWIGSIGLAFVFYTYFRTRMLSKAIFYGLLSGLSFTMGYGLATIPIWPVIYKFVFWVGKLTLTQGRYISGDFGIFSIDAIIENINEINKSLVFYITLFIIPIIIIWLVRRRHEWRKFIFFIAYILALFIHLMVLIIMMVKQFSPNYIGGPAVLVVFLVIATLWILLKDTRKMGRGLQFLVSSIILFIFIVNLVSSFEYMKVYSYETWIMRDRYYEELERNPINIEEASLIVFDAHTAYRLDFCASLSILGMPYGKDLLWEYFPENCFRSASHWGSATKDWDYWIAFGRGNPPLKNQQNVTFLKEIDLYIINDSREKIQP